jgi:hypothetical protein
MGGCHREAAAQLTMVISFMKRKLAIRIVLASPGDVQPERDAVSNAISNTNQLLRAADLPAVLELTVINDGIAKADQVSV